MAILAKDDNLFIFYFLIFKISYFLIVLFLDALLKVQDHRTSSINQVDAVLSSKSIG